MVLSKLFVALIVGSSLLQGHGFQYKANFALSRSVRSFRQASSLKSEFDQVELKDPTENEQISQSWFSNLPQNILMIAPMVSTLLLADPAFADGNSYGILAGRTASLIHPFTNFALFGTSIYSAYLGLQWRRLRDIGEEMKTLTSSLPKLTTTQAKFPVSETVFQLNQQVASLASSPEAGSKIAEIQKDLQKLSQVTELDVKYKELTDIRKSLLSANLRDKHYVTGAILLGAGVTVSILGAFNTYMRAGRLFPGPHLYAGM
eukprot:gene4708-5044_t